VSKGLALKVAGIDVYYKDFHALWNVSLETKEGEITSVIGANGSGKSTLLSTVSGILAPAAGTIEFFGERIDGLPPHETVARGLSMVPEGRRIFPRLTVYENLMMGSYSPRSRAVRNRALNKILELFPILKARSDQMGNTLSGGDNRCWPLAGPRVRPKLILCDEISLGLAPVIIKDIYKELKRINEQGITIVLVEQDITRSLKAAGYDYILLQGKVVLEGKPSSLHEEAVKKAYFGV
jgi:branched-chain amino acid transport system ATP-binding protein